MGVLENKTEAKDELVTETIETEATEPSDPVVQPAETETVVETTEAKADSDVESIETETKPDTIEAGPDTIESESNVESIEAENPPFETIEKEVLEPLDVVEAPTETEDTEKSNSAEIEIVEKSDPPVVQPTETNETETTSFLESPADAKSEIEPVKTEANSVNETSDPVAKLIEPVLEALETGAKPVPSDPVENLKPLV